MLKFMTLIAFAILLNSASAAPVSTLTCKVAKTKETFSMKVKIGKNVIEDIIVDKNDNYVTAADGTDVSAIGVAEISELEDGSQVFETDMAGVEQYTLILTSASGFLKGTFELVVWDRVTSSNKPYKSTVSCTKK